MCLLSTQKNTEVRKGVLCSEHPSDHLPTLAFRRYTLRCPRRMKQELGTALEETETVLVIFKILLKRIEELLNIVFEDLRKVYVNKTSELV